MRTIDRTEIILEELIHQGDYVTSSYLAERTGVTARTIREDIKLLSHELSKHHIQLRSTPSKGYCIPKDEKDKAASYFDFRRSKTAHTPTLPSERVQTIIHQLLFKTDPLNIEHLLDELYIARSTLEKDLQEVERWLAIHKLKLLKRRDSSLMVDGKEIAIRYAMINYFWSFEGGKEATILAALQDIVQNEDIHIIQDALYDLSMFKSNHISDAEYLNLMMYISFSLWRSRNHHPIEKDSGDETAFFNPGKSFIVNLLVKQIEERSSFHFPESEKNSLARFLLQSAVCDEDSSHHLSHSNLEYMDFVRQILLQLKDIYSIDFSEDGILSNSLVQYIRSLVQQTTHKTYIKNPSLDGIRKEYPNALEMAITISGNIQETYQILPDEDEIGFIALYLCAAIERDKIAFDSPPKKVAIICATGIGGSQLLTVKIQRNFRNLEIVGVYPAFILHQAIQKAPDFIISTIPLEGSIIPVIHISHVLNDDDLSEIRQFLDDKRSNPLKPMDAIFYHLFRPETYFTNISAVDKDGTIRSICNQLQQIGLVDKQYVQSVLDRERIFSTSIGNLVAIPHALNAIDSDSFITVAILPKSIPWGTEKAQLIFLLHLAPSSGPYFNEIYEKLFDIVNERKKVEKILKIKDFKEFIKVLNE